ncbi:serine hydrolase domain-containing protein [Microtetraspora malaysiensis]|uniref:serine hydrolase domain-containing protein n=1 Tax=Microtetraspora malaysiensis TaxID=161358 RepID=UPI003D9464BC
MRTKDVIHALNARDLTALSSLITEEAAVILLAQVKATGPLEIREAAEDRCLLFAPLVRNWYELTAPSFELEPVRDPDPRPLQGSADERADVATAYLLGLAEADMFSGVVRLSRGDEVLFEEVYGLAERTHRRPNLPGTPFNVGSMNKMMTSVCIGQLVEQGKLRLDDAVGTHLPDFRPDITGRITIRQLLTHTSGMGDFFTPRFFAGARHALETIDAHLDLIRDDDLLFEPGSRFQYSNAGFALLGAIIEEKMQCSYFDYIRKHVFDPAGMRSSGFPAFDEFRDEAVGYSNFTAHGAVTGPRRPHDDTLPRRGSSAGGGYCSALDLARFGDALMNDALVGADVKTMLLDVGNGDLTGRPGGIPYAQGFMVQQEHGVLSYGHGGGGPGISSFMDVFPEQGLTLVAVSNYDSGARAIRPELRRIFWPAD